MLEDRETLLEEVLPVSYTHLRAHETLMKLVCRLLLEKFADATKKKGGEFFTPREVVKLLVNLTHPKEGMKISDPTCGSGGMLIVSRRYVEKHKGNPRDLVLDGQESNYGNLAMCKMNMVLHGIVDFNITYGDTLANPKQVENGKLKTYDRVLANFPFSMNWDNKGAEKDPYNLSLIHISEPTRRS